MHVIPFATETFFLRDTLPVLPPPPSRPHVPPASIRSTISPSLGNMRGCNGRTGGSCTQSTENGSTAKRRAVLCGEVSLVVLWSPLLIHSLRVLCADACCPQCSAPLTCWPVCVWDCTAPSEAWRPWLWEWPCPVIITGPSCCLSLVPAITEPQQHTRFPLSL